MGSPYRRSPFRKQPDNEAPADLIPDNGQVERMNRTIKDATVKRYFYETHDQLRAHLRDFVDAYNFARRLKTLRGLTPYEFVCKAWTSQPQRFKISPLQQMPGLKVADRIGLEFAFGGGFAFDLGQPGDPVALQTPVQGRARQMRDRRAAGRTGSRRAAAKYAFGRRRRRPLPRLTGPSIWAPWVLSADRKRRTALSTWRPSSG